MRKMVKDDILFVENFLDFLLTIYSWNSTNNVMKFMKKILEGDHIDHLDRKYRNICYVSLKIGKN